MKNLILTTDTLHHRFFLKEIINLTETIIIFETKKIKYKNKLPNNFIYNQNKFEKKYFFNNKIPNFNIKKFKDLNYKNSINFIKKCKFDNIICFGIGKLKQNFLTRFKNKTILNFHGGNPSYYRGLDSLLWSIYKNDFKKLYSCLHFVENRLDTGGIVLKKKIVLKKNTKLYELRALNTINIVSIYKKFLKLKKVTSKKQNKIGDYYSAFPGEKIKKCIKNLKNYGNK